MLALAEIPAYISNDVIGERGSASSAGPPAVALSGGGHAASATPIASSRCELDHAQSSWPTIIPLLIVSYVYGNRKLHRLGGPNVDEFLAGAEPPYEGMQRGF